MVNILTGIINIVEYGEFNLNEYKSKSKISINSVGELLEEYIKEAISNSFYFSDKKKKIELQSVNLSYGGNQNNPPDMIITKGDAIEVKKIESPRSSIALNSSFPKDMLYIDDEKINSECRNVLSEEGDPKDIFYVIGFVKSKKICYLQIIHGKCYCANKSIYQGILSRVKQSTEDQLEALGIEHNETKEIARINKVDPLGITYFRIRGMWGIANPIIVFDYLYTINLDRIFSLIFLITKEKFMTYPEKDRLSIKNHSKLDVQELKIKNPNNTTSLIEVVLVTLK